MPNRPLVRAALTAFAFAASLLSLHAGAMAQSDQGGAMTEREFARFAARASLAEIREAQIALDKSKNDTVQRYAKMMVDDHTSSNADLAKIATSENVTLPKILTAQQDGEASQLQGLSGGDFDKQYMSDQVSGHYKVVAAAQATVEVGSTPALKAYATQYLAAEQRHLRMAQAVVSNADKYLK